MPLDYADYERRTANWLNGETMPSLYPGYDIITQDGYKIQVKYARPYAGNRKATWNFNQGKLGCADFYVLFGLSDDGNEHCFLMPSNDFVKLSADNGKGGRIYQLNAQKISLRGGARTSYYHNNRGWEYEVENPEMNLYKRLTEYIRTLSLQPLREEVQRTEKIRPHILQNYLFEV